MTRYPAQKGAHHFFAKILKYYAVLVARSAHFDRRTILTKNDVNLVGRDWNPAASIPSANMAAKNAALRFSCVALSFPGFVKNTLVFLPGVFICVALIPEILYSPCAKLVVAKRNSGC
jgi:hypothetical protein